jgi:hypothetical protein
VSTTASPDVVAKMNVLPLPNFAYLSFSPTSLTLALKYLNEQIMHFSELPFLLDLNLYDTECKRILLYELRL